MTVIDKSVKLYDTSQGDYKVLKKYQVSGVGWSILDIAFSPDKSSFVYSSWSESCKGSILEDRKNYQFSYLCFQFLNSIFTFNTWKYRFSHTTSFKH